MSETLKRILLIEDDPDIQAVARLALEALGKFVVHVCASGDSALQEAPSFAPDVILLDMMLPGMDGVSTLQRLRDEAHISAPVIFVTAKVEAVQESQYTHLNVIGVIPKPFDPMRLAGIVRTLWEKYHER